MYYREGPTYRRKVEQWSAIILLIPHKSAICRDLGNHPDSFLDIRDGAEFISELRLFRNALVFFLFEVDDIVFLCGLCIYGDLK